MRLDYFDALRVNYHLIHSSSMHTATMLTGIWEPASRLPAILSVVGNFCGLLGILAWNEYATFAMRGINAVFHHETEAAHRMASFTGLFSFSQLLLGVLSVGLGWTARAKGVDSRIVRVSGVSAMCLGSISLLLLMLLV